MRKLLAILGCGFVLWANPQVDPFTGRHEWHPIEGFSSYTQCLEAISKMSEKHRKWSNPACFPSDFDPRPRSTK